MKIVEIYLVYIIYYISKYLFINLVLIFIKILFFLFGIYLMIWGKIDVYFWKKNVFLVMVNIFNWKFYIVGLLIIC